METKKTRGSHAETSSKFREQPRLAAELDSPLSERGGGRSTTKDVRTCQMAALRPRVGHLFNTPYIEGWDRRTIPRHVDNINLVGPEEPGPPLRYRARQRTRPVMLLRRGGRVTRRGI